MFNCNSKRTVVKYSTITLSFSTSNINQGKFMFSISNSKHNYAKRFLIVKVGRTTSCWCLYIYMLPFYYTYAMREIPLLCKFSRNLAPFTCGSGSIHVTLLDQAIPNYLIHLKTFEKIFMVMETNIFDEYIK